MRSEEFIDESINTPYNYDFDRHVEWGSKVGGKTVKGMSARFMTADDQKYKVIAQKIGFTKVERDVTAELRKKQAAERERYQAARAANPDKPHRKKRLMIRPSAYGVPPGGIWEIHFHKDDDQADDDVEAHSGITGTGDAFRVFATVFEIIKDIIKYGKPEILSIKSKADEPSRTKLYKRLAKKFAPSLGYHITSEKLVGDTLRLELRKVDI